jgi:hypothetical protein
MLQDSQGFSSPLRAKMRSFKSREFQQARQPVISVDTKKKELVGDFKNNGREMRPKGDPDKVRDCRTGTRRSVRGLRSDKERRMGERGDGRHDTAAFAAGGS